MMEEREQPTWQIRAALKEMEFSLHIKREDNEPLREYWLASEIFQVLRICFMNTSYRVRQEYPYGDVRPDLLIVQRGGNRRYAVEVKRAQNMDSMNRLTDQLKDARREIDNLTRAFVFVYSDGEEWLPEKNESVDASLDYADEHDWVDVYIKGQESVATY